MEGKIYAAISDVMADIGAVGKNDLNKTQGFKYRGIDAVMNALNPAMVKHKVFCSPEVLDQQREERTTKSGSALIYSICRIKYRFYTTDGSFVESVTVGEGMDSGDKATNKAMAIAFKYACFQVFCIPTEEMSDPDGESPEVTPKGSKKPAGHEPKKTDVKKITADQISHIEKELKRTGIDAGIILDKYHVMTFNDMSAEQYMNCMNRFAVTSDSVV